MYQLFLFPVFSFRPFWLDGKFQDVHVSMFFLLPGYRRGLGIQLGGLSVWQMKPKGTGMCQLLTLQLISAIDLLCTQIVGVGVGVAICFLNFGPQFSFFIWGCLSTQYGVLFLY